MLVTTNNSVIYSEESLETAAMGLYKLGSLKVIKIKILSGITTTVVRRNAITAR